MKYISVAIFLFFAVSSYSQKCDCSINPVLKDIIDCEPIVFDNKATLYWDYDCDSSWLTFQNQTEKVPIFKMDTFIVFTGRLGFSFAAEYQKSFLIQNAVVSGCCDPPEYILFDKNTGRELTNLGRIIYFSTNKDLPFIVSVSGSNYDSVFSDDDYKTLVILNVDKMESFRTLIPNDFINKTLTIQEGFYPELLFDEVHLKGANLIMPYRYRMSLQDSTDHIGTMEIDLASYK